MQIRKIKKFNEYKSFTEFNWENFCQDKNGREQILSKYSIIYGENGSGKTSIVDMLKDLSSRQILGQNSPKPKIVELEINNKYTIYRFTKENGWENKVEKDKIQFFDVDFINRNVHTHGERKDTKNAHAQNSGNLIIDLDEKSNELKKKMKNAKKNLSTFITENKVVLEDEVTESDEKYLKKIKKSKPSKVEFLKSKKEKLKQLENKIGKLKKTKEKHSTINSIDELGKFNKEFKIKEKDYYVEIYKKEIIKNVKKISDEKIRNHIENHKNFIDTGLTIIKNKNIEYCPFCMRPNDKIKEILEKYNNFFDDTYEKERNAYVGTINRNVSELKKIKNEISILPEFVLNMFGKIEKLDKKYGIREFYDIDEKEDFTPPVESINKFKINVEKLIKKLINLKSLDYEKDISECKNTLDEILKEHKNIFEFIVSLNEFIGEKNKQLRSFTEQYSDIDDVIKEINHVKSSIEDISNFIQFISNNRDERISKIGEANKVKEELHDIVKKTKEELEEYLRNKIPNNIIDHMISVLSNFNLDFTLKHISVPKNTKSYPFSFSIIDNEETVRPFKTGLSEGERQLISLAFFFALNRNVPNKGEKVLVFDDPITSLDSSNLKQLASLVYSETADFGQILIFTHHSLFYKYLIKEGAKGGFPDPVKYGIVKNSKDFGGSFLFYDPGFDVINELELFESNIRNEASNGALDVEMIAIKYGQILRLAVERFIKHDLLMWNRNINFKNLIDELSKNNNNISKLSDDDYESINSIYNYCNWSNLMHADKQEMSALSELKKHILKFVEIHKKVLQQ